MNALKELLASSNFSAYLSERHRISINRFNISSNLNCSELDADDPGATELNEVLSVIDLYVFSALAVIGLLGNGLSVLVICRYLLHTSGTYVLFLAMSLSDSLLLSVQLHEYFKKSLHDFSLPMSSAECKLVKFSWFFTYQLSAWMVVSMTVDRSITLRYFYRKQEKGTVVRRSLIMCLCIVLVIFLSNVHLLFIFDVVEEYSLYCRKKSNYYCTPATKNIIVVVNRVHLVMYGLLPYTMTLLSNAYLIHQIRTCPHTKHRKTTLLLLLVTFSFIVLTLPHFVVRIFIEEGALKPGSYENHDKYYMVMILWYVSQFLLLVNNGCNVVYFMVGKRFRMAFRAMVRNQPLDPVYRRKSSHLTRLRVVRPSLNRQITRRKSEGTEKCDSAMHLDFEEGPHTPMSLALHCIRTDE